MSSGFHHYIQKLGWAFLVLILLLWWYTTFGGKILAYKHVFMLTHRLYGPVGHCCCIWDWVRGCRLTGKLQDNSGPHETAIFDCFSASLSNEFVTKTLLQVSSHRVAAWALNVWVKHSCDASVVKLKGLCEGVKQIMVRSSQKKVSYINSVLFKCSWII